jgi:hypothetical protein
MGRSHWVWIVEDLKDDTLLNMHELRHGSHTFKCIETIDAMHASLKLETCSLAKLKLAVLASSKLSVKRGP